MEVDINQNRPEEGRPPPKGKPTAERSFDELAKGLANRSLSRGDALKWIGGALLGGMLASIPGAAWAQGSGGGGVGGGSGGGGGVGGGGSGGGGVGGGGGGGGGRGGGGGGGISPPPTVCDPGFADCDGVGNCEVNLNNDPNNCGSCGIMCLSGTCQGGSCVCQPGFADCDRNGHCEANLDNDPNNCGSCRNICPSGTCQGGVCVA